MILTSLASAYAILMVVFAAGWLRAGRRKKTEAPAEPWPDVSIIIPARNEAANIRALIHSILCQEYPGRIEAIIVDDDSTDQTAALAGRFEAWHIRYLYLGRDEETAAPGFVAFKKRALAAGIAASRGQLILTTDADCVARPLWVRAMVEYWRERKAVAVAGPVTFHSHAGFFQEFQATDFLVMQGITAAVLQWRIGSMANGANLLFTREAYDRAGGYEAAMHLASGDDMMLIARMRKLGLGRVSYCKRRDAVVYTEAPRSVWAFLNQRIRWASKSGKYPDPGLNAVLMLVYLFNAALLAGIIGACFVPGLLGPVVLLLWVKFLAESLLAIPVFRFFNRGNLVFPLLAFQIPHVFYIVLSGFFGMIGRYEWKGRQVR